MTPTLSLRVPALKRPLTNPKNPPRPSSTQRLFQRGTLQDRWRATRPRSRDTDWTLSSYDSNSRRGSPRAGKLLYPMSPAAQECWDSTGQFLTRGFQESRPLFPLHASDAKGLLSSLTQGLRKRLNMQKEKQTEDFLPFLLGKLSPALPAV